MPSGEMWRGTLGDEVDQISDAEFVDTISTIIFFPTSGPLGLL